MAAAINTFGDATDELGTVHAGVYVVVRGNVASIKQRRARDPFVTRDAVVSVAGPRLNRIITFEDGSTWSVVPKRRPCCGG